MTSCGALLIGTLVVAMQLASFPCEAEIVTPTAVISLGMTREQWRSVLSGVDFTARRVYMHIGYVRVHFDVEPAAGIAVVEIHPLCSVHDVTRNSSRVGGWDVHWCVHGVHHFPSTERFRSKVEQLLLQYEQRLTYGPLFRVERINNMTVPIDAYGNVGPLRGLMDGNSTTISHSEDETASITSTETLTTTSSPTEDDTSSETVSESRTRTTPP